MEFGFSIVRSEEGRGFQDFHPENARDGVKPQREAFHYASFCSILLWDITRVRGSGPSQLELAVWGVTLHSRCDEASLGLNPWDVHSIEPVVARGDRLQEIVGDKATALK